MAGNNEIFTVSEKVILEKRKNESQITVEKYDKLLKASKEKVKIYAEIDTALDNLEANASIKIDERIDEKIKLIEKFYEKEDKKKSSIDKVKKLKDKTNKKIKEKGIAAAEKALPGSGKALGFFDKIINAFDKAGEAFDEKGFFAAIMIFIGLMFGGDDEEKEDKKDLEKKDKTKVEPVNVAPIGDEENDDIKNYKYDIGFNLILSLSGVKFVENETKGIISNNLKNKSYEEFLNKKNDTSFKNEILGDKKDNENQKEQYERVSKGLSSNKVQTLFRVGLKKERVEKILMGIKGKTENKKLKESFGIDRFNTILKMTKSASFDYKKLTIKELSELYIYTVPSIVNGTLHKGLEGFSGLVSGFLGNDKIKDEIDKTKEGIFSKELMESLFKGDGKTKIKSPLEDLKKLLTGEKDLKDLEKIYDFKEYILGEFLKSKLLGLNYEEKKLLITKFNYKNIVALYGIMGGDKIENLNVVNLPLVILALSKIIGFGTTASDSMVGSGLVYRFSKNLLLNDESLLTEDQYKVLDIYKDKIMDMMILSHMKHFYSILGIATDKEGMKKAALTSGVVGVSGIYVGNKWIKSNLSKGKFPFFSLWTKRLGWIGVASGVVLGGLSIMETEDDFEKYNKDLEKAYTNQDVNEVIKILEKQKKGVKKYEKDGKELLLVSYENSTPYIIYDGKVYKFTVIDKSGSINEAGMGNFLLGALGGLVFIGNDTTVDGKSVNKIAFDGTNIILGDNIKKVNFTESISKWEQVKMDKNISAKITSLVKKVNPDLKFELGTPESENMFKIGNISETLMLGLIPVGELEIKEIK